MRIVAVADTHISERDLGALPEGDVFVHAGDLLARGGLEELRAVSEWIRALPHRWKVVVAGNHDWCFVNEPTAARALLGDAIYLEDSGAIVGGVTFWGSPWQPLFNDWAFNLPRGAPLAAKWNKIPDHVDVLITHGPPAGFGDRGPMAGRLGCADLLSRVQEVQPALHLFGHIHQDGGVWRNGSTCFANVTTWECERAATVLDLDPDTREVAEVAVPPSRLVAEP